MASPVGNSQPPPRARKGSGSQPKPVKVRSLSELAVKYDFSEPDLFVGPKTSQYVLDYGEPVLLADSARENDDAKPRLLDRILDRF